MQGHSVSHVDASVCVVSYNTREHLRACLEALRDQGAPQIVVADNASSDGTVEMLSSHFPEARLILNGSNRGYGPAANQAIRETTTRYVLLLNPDTVPAPAALERLVAYAERHREAAIVGPRIVNPDGSLQPSCYPRPTPWHVLLEASGVNRVLPGVPGLRRLALRSWRHDRPRRVPWLLGAALLMRRADFDALGGFDERFPLYYEETDLCTRAWDAGREVHFAPVANVTHVGGASSAGDSAGTQRRWEAGVRAYYGKHYGPPRRMQLEAVLRILALIRGLRAWIAGRADR